MRRGVFCGQRGMSLVEVTIILLVLMLLTGVLAPSISDFVNDAKAVKVKEDCELIGINVMRQIRDNGPCIKFAAGTACTQSNRVEILVSDGPEVVGGDLSGDAAALTVEPAGTVSNNFTWSSDDDPITGDKMEDQWTSNLPGYPLGSSFTPSSHLSAKPCFGCGWRILIQSPISGDPYGKPYLVNTLYLVTGSDATAGGTEGFLSGFWEHPVFCISAGRNARYETHFSGRTPHVLAGLVRGGDDETYPFAQGTR